jgi:hypothetical protein
MEGLLDGWREAEYCDRVVRPRISMPKMRIRAHRHSDPHVSSGFFKKLLKANGVPSFEIRPLGALH